MSNDFTFMRQILGCSEWAHRKNEYILKKLEISLILDYIQQHQNNWRQYGKLMSRSRISKALLPYQLKREKSMARPIKIWTIFPPLTGLGILYYIITGR